MDGHYLRYLKKKELILFKTLCITSATRQVRQQWFSVGIFPPRQLFGLTGNRPQSAPACSFLRITKMYSI
jgi:hypothetical protein